MEEAFRLRDSRYKLEQALFADTPARRHRDEVAASLAAYCTRINGHHADPWKPSKDGGFGMMGYLARHYAGGAEPICNEILYRSVQTTDPWLRAHAGDLCRVVRNLFQILIACGAENNDQLVMFAFESFFHDVNRHAQERIMKAHTSN